ncbi:alpha/beta hydrolase-fold protein [Paraglaciecola chathamensis]|uniref:alpha/beta hydrolase-fold protein n=1 Tax=Paraglaciecola chathamensis TaxID=368405 RepID=UPI001D04259C|nr:alpha/beta hydrolase-fold protein [Paraglaciecola agarilytica]
MRNPAKLTYYIGLIKPQTLALRFDCGTDDSLIDANRWLHQQLVARKISHEYQEYAGTHEWAYWHEHVAESFKWFSAIEKRHKSAV